MDNNFDNSSYNGNNQGNQPYYTDPNQQNQNYYSNPQDSQANFNAQDPYANNAQGSYTNNTQGGYNANNTYYSQDPNPQFYAQNDGYQEPPKTNGLAIASLVLGIVSIPMCCCTYFGIICGVLGLIFGLLSKPKTGPNAGKLNGLAIAGIICGAIGLVLSVILLIVSLSAANYSSNLYSEWLDEFYN